MDIKIWENTVIDWLNSLSGHSPIISLQQISDSVLQEVTRKISLNSESNPNEFLKSVFQNQNENDSLNFNLSVDCLCASTLLLVYVSLSKKEELKDVREIMCTKLSTSTQLNIVEFLSNIQEYEDVFNISFERFKQEIFPQIFLNFKEKHCVQDSLIGDGSFTPVKNDVSNVSFDSPLQGFFQTPKRNGNKYSKSAYSMCGGGDHIKHIKKLTDQLVEEESEKTSLQEKLNIQTQKCNEFELKLKSKIEEINHLKEEWEKESKKNETDVNSLKNKLMEKLESEKKLKNEITHLEKYVSNLELDLSNFGLKNDKLENQLKTALEQFTINEVKLKEASALCVKLQSTINDKEKELEQFREQYANFYQDEKAIDVSFLNGSFDKSISSPENLGVVVDKMLREKIDENVVLQETVEKLKAEKIKFENELKLLNEQLVQKCSVISELQYLKKELCAKVENFEKQKEEVFQLQKELLDANAVIAKLNKENSHLIEKYNILNSRVQEREQVIIKSNNSKMLLQINFLKLAEDFKAVQQRLELEVKNISRLTFNKFDGLLKTEADLTSSEICEVKDFKDALHKKSFNNTHLEQNFLETKNEMSYRLDSFLTDKKVCKLADLLENFEDQVEWNESKASLQKTCNSLNDNIIVLKAKVREFEEHHRKTLEAKIKFEKELKEAEKKLTVVESTGSLEIAKLTQELEEKKNKIKELENIITNLKNAQEQYSVEKEVITKGEKNKSMRTVVFRNITEVSDEKTEQFPDVQEFSDSLEEVPADVPNKTFDIVNLEEKNMGDKTFSIKKEDLEIFSKNLKCESAWVVSPPSKVPLKKPVKDGMLIPVKKGSQEENWVVNSFKSKESRLKKVSSSINDLRMKNEEIKMCELQKEILALSKESERFKSALLECEQKRARDKELFEKNQDIIRQNITAKYESQLEHLKSEMKQLYNRELAKHKQEQTRLSSELQDQNKRYKEHIDELRNQLWDLGEKLLQEQTLMRDLKRSFNDLKEKYDRLMFSKDPEMKNINTVDLPRQKESSGDENVRTSLRQISSVTFPTIPTEDEDEVFDNRFLEDMKLGVFKTERPDDRLKELQYRNSLCLPHLKSSYPGETQFHNPALFKESDLKMGLLQFTQESQSLTDSDHSMTRSLLPDNKGKKKEQTSYKRPGPPTPSKNGGRVSIQSGDLRMTPRNVLKELNDQNERNKGTPNPLKFLLTSKVARRGSVGGKDENAAPVTPRKKNFFRKPFGARDH